MAKLEVRFKRGFRLNGDPGAIHGEIERVREKHGGEVTPELIVKAARRRGSALHGEFVWDDQEASALYRLAQARYVLRAIEVVRVDQDDSGVRVYETVRRVAATGDPDADEGRSYMTRDDILADSDLREQFVERALGELRSWARKYCDIGELRDIVASVEIIVNK